MESQYATLTGPARIDLNLAPQAVGYRTVFTRNDGSGKGCGFAKNQAVRVSHGRFLAFADADDVHCPRRLCMQLAAARERPNAIVGCQFTRCAAQTLPHCASTHFIIKRDADLAQDPR